MTTEFGLQDKQQVLHPGEAQPDGSVRYEIAVQARRTPQTNVPRFLGPVVHGTPTTPFLYLSLRRTELGQASWIRRLKISLAAISWEQIAVASATPSGCLEASVDGTGSATVPLLGAGWTPQETCGS